MHRVLNFQRERRLHIVNFGEKLIHGIGEGWWMFFDTFWALVFGFTLSGAIQTFISRARMRESLGGHRSKEVARASFFGVVSSSCSYAASALAKSIFNKGADFTTSMIFMFASTNLVIELGFVLWILMGWQFAVAQFVGGIIMILLLAFTIPRMIPRQLIEKAQEVSFDSSMRNSDGEEPIGVRIRQRAQWRSAAGYTVGDFTMMRVELVVGFLIAGLAAYLVPQSFWNSLFLHGHGFLAIIENAIIGPFIAIISFVCSVGNVPLAAALWASGISFGGTISFIFADLISLPLIVIYRKYYGGALTLRLVALFWAVMALSGLLTQGIFNLLGLTPHHMTMVMATKHWGANATTILNGAALILLGVVMWLHWSKSEASTEFAQDPICGMQVRISDAPAHTQVDGVDYYFCMPGCKEKFLQRAAT
jgi:uncharacterized membrane protein YraQ (UPF0718 family)/YHS domain-containing protein